MKYKKHRTDVCHFKKVRREHSFDINGIHNGNINSLASLILYQLDY